MNVAGAGRLVSSGGFRQRYRKFFFSSRRRHTRCYRDWSSDVCSSDLPDQLYGAGIVNARNSLTQSLAPPHQLYARLYDATSGAVVATQAAGSDGSYAFAGLSEGSYDVRSEERRVGEGGRGRGWPEYQR